MLVTVLDIGQEYCRDLLHRHALVGEAAGSLDTARHAEQAAPSSEESSQLEPKLHGSRTSLPHGGHKLQVYKWSVPPNLRYVSTINFAWKIRTHIAVRGSRAKPVTPSSTDTTKSNRGGGEQHGAEQLCDSLGI
jgi:hypothetical protein